MNSSFGRILRESEESNSRILIKKAIDSIEPHIDDLWSNGDREAAKVLLRAKEELYDLCDDQK